MSAGGTAGRGYGRPVLVDLWLPTVNPLTTAEVLTALGPEADQRGIHGIWVGEHVVLFDEYDSSYPYADDGRMPAAPGSGLLDPFVVLSFLAACTSRVRLGTAMALLPQRNPVYTAKEVASIDYLSNGRVDLGVGVGWLREEFEALNVPWPRRGARADEYLEILRALWCEEVSSYDGEFHQLPQCRMDPKPVQTPHPPIHIGGESDAALRRVARAAQGWMTFNRRPGDLAEPLKRLDELLAEHGRARSDIEVTACPYFKEFAPDDVEAFAEAGAARIAVLFIAADPDGVRSGLDALEPVLERARALA